MARQRYKVQNKICKQEKEENKTLNENIYLREKMIKWRDTPIWRSVSSNVASVFEPCNWQGNDVVSRFSWGCANPLESFFISGQPHVPNETVKHHTQSRFLFWAIPLGICEVDEIPYGYESSTCNPIPLKYLIPHHQGIVTSNECVVNQFNQFVA